ncbi:MAG: DUF3048 domain-containing protein [Faecalimonas sp.]|nr:DUF3048 domain-containing protein [Faecalimonas sp.]
MKRGIRGLAYVAVFLMLLSCCACGKKGKLVKTEMPDNGPMISAAPEKTGPGANQNLLTGIDDLSKEAIGKRPVAVMVNNVEAALPQYGVAQADVIFELPVEGNLTRLMALYGDYTTMPDICAIRSCRYYYPAIAQGFDAFYVHWGSDQTIISYVNSLGIDRYDGIANPHALFGRDTSRRQAGYSMEHTGYFKGTKFAEAVEADGKRTELKDSKKGTAFPFAAFGELVTPTGGACTQAHIRFGAATATFNYDADKQVYYKKINGHDHIDGKTKETLSFTNVFVLETSISVRDEAGHKKINWAGSANAKGYYISNGSMEPIRWSKANGDEDAYLRFYRESGEELVINRGKSYIAYTTPGTVSLQ